MLAIEKLRGMLRARYTDDFVRNMASEGTKLLKDIPRDETVGGCKLIIERTNGPAVTRVLLSRTTDYEFARFAPVKADMIAACDRAIRELGRRLDLCIQGEHVAKDFHGQPVRSEMWPSSMWPEGAVLYSLGPAPQLLDYFGQAIFRVALSGGNDDTVPTYREDYFEARFGYYANVGPKGTLP